MIYLAGPLFTDYQRHRLEEVETIIRDAGAKPFSPAKESQRIWKGRPPSECTPADRRAVAEMNAQAVRGSSFVLAWLRGTGGPFTDQGTVWEMGYASARSIPVVGWLTIVEAQALPDLNLMIAETLAGLVLSTEIHELIGTPQERWAKDYRVDRFTTTEELV